MKIRRLRVEEFASIREADIEFAQGLNVLHGPNDLGKSTLAEAIRLALLLPHTSTHIEDYIPWTGGGNPVVELTFQTEEQRIYRVKKEFRKGGSALLQESRNGRDFDDVERARKVDAKLREILHWGIPEPGGAGGSRGLPTSFLATALLSTQANVTAVLSDSLQNDDSGSGRERIAAALQAVAQDPLFQALLTETQARRDEAYTPKGEKKKARGSVLKAAADRVREIREEKERYHAIVEDSEGVESQLRHLVAQRDQQESAVVELADRFKTLERAWTQSAEIAVAAQQVELARAEVERIRRIDSDIRDAERCAAELQDAVNDVKEELSAAQERHAAAHAALKSAEEAARASGSDSEALEMVTRKALELRKLGAEQAASTAQGQIDAVLAARKLADAAASAEREYQEKEQGLKRAQTAATAASTRVAAVTEELRRVGLLGRALDVRLAEEREAAARTDVEKAAALRSRLEAETRECENLRQARAKIAVPSTAALLPMRRLSTELARARGALDVGLLVSVTPRRPFALEVRKDGTAVYDGSLQEPFEIDARAGVDLVIGDLATVRIRGGRPDAQKTLESLGEQWTREVVPHLTAVGVSDLDTLAVKVDDAQRLDAAVIAKDGDIESLRTQIELTAGSVRAMKEASERLRTCRAALGDTALESLATDLAQLGTNPEGELRARRQRVSGELQTAQQTLNQGLTDTKVAEERSRHAKLALDAAVQARDSALASFPAGLTETLAAAQASLEAAFKEVRTVTDELASLDRTVAAEKARIEAAASGARASLEQMRVAAETAQRRLTQASTEHGTKVGALDQLRKLRESEDLPGAEARVQAASHRHAALPVPERTVSDEDLAEVRRAQERAKAELERLQREIQRAQGALEQVGGAVARDRLREATEAFDLAEQHERQTELEYEAWRLLLEQMKAADAAQASDLGHALAPAIARRFEALTQKRYENVRLTAHLETDGVVIGGAVRSTERISVGTREQLSTLYRLSLAEYLQTTLVLDDQLVQSDDTRMDWFRKLLAEKARAFQIIVFTCRPADYLGIVPKREAAQNDIEGSVRAINLARAIRPR